MADSNSVYSLGKHSQSEKGPSLAVPPLAVEEIEALKVSDRLLLRKLDWNLLPLVSILHLLSFLYVLLWHLPKVSTHDKNSHLTETVQTLAMLKLQAWKRT